MVDRPSHDEKPEELPEGAICVFRPSDVLVHQVNIAKATPLQEITDEVRQRVRGGAVLTGLGGPQVDVQDTKVVATFAVDSCFAHLAELAAAGGTEQIRITEEGTRQLVPQVAFMLINSLGVNPYKAFTVLSQLRSDLISQAQESFEYPWGAKLVLDGNELVLELDVEKVRQELQVPGSGESSQ